MTRLLIALYPEAWRRRYAEELEALLEDSRPGPRELADLLRGALRAHLRPLRGLAPLERARNSVSGVLGCFILCLFFAGAFAKTTENVPSENRAHTLGLLSAAHAAVMLTLLAAGAALAVAAAPLALRALREARLTRRADLILLICVPPLAIGALLAVLGLSALWFHSHGGRGDVVTLLLLVICGVTAVVAAFACWAASRALLRRIELGREQIVPATAAVAAVALAMLASAVAMALYLAVMVLDAPAIATTADGPGGIGMIGPDVGVQLVAILGLSTIALVSARRGLSSLRAG
jgi:hypothetical protein